jgi:arylformamidase
VHGVPAPCETAAAVEIRDISVPIREGMPHYPGDPAVSLQRVASIADGAIANISALDFGVHTGTHIDAPLHFIDDGGGADALRLSSLIGPADVVDATAIEEGPIGERELRALDIPSTCTRLLLKTKNSEFWESDDYRDDFLSLDSSGAGYVVERGIVLVGIDYLSIGDPEAHRILLGQNVIPVEGLDLGAVDPGRYTLLCLPLRIVGSDGAPARAVLVRD